MGIGSLQKRAYICLSILLLTTVICFILQPQTNYTNNPHQTVELRVIYDGFDKKKIEEWFSLRNSTNNLSRLGRILFLGEAEPKPNNNKTYQILVWKYGATIENRHLKNFSDKRTDPFRHCSVKNCDITYSDSALKTADIVIVHLHRTKNVKDLPNERNPTQIWAFLTDESPHHTFLHGGVKMTDFNGKFNWSMTYRMDSDIPVPYGRTVLKTQSDILSEPNLDITLNKRRDVLIAILGSNCGGKNHRWDYVKELQKHIKVDVYGKCGSFKTCPGHFKSNCPDIENYLFYLSFENSNCDEYITEKAWWNAFNKNSIPIVMGANKQSYEKIMPINSYINVDDFASPAVLAEFILRLNKTGEFENYYKWKRNFKVLNEHGYFQSESYHYCRVCQALNYNSREKKIYQKLEEFWSSKRDCYPAWNT